VISHNLGVAPKNKKPVSKLTTGRKNFFYFGNPAIPIGPVAFRPTIARGLALSVNLTYLIV
jgi:hypothetical protein